MRKKLNRIIALCAAAAALLTLCLPAALAEESTAAQPAASSSAAGNSDTASSQSAAPGSSQAAPGTSSSGTESGTASRPAAPETVPAPLVLISMPALAGPLAAGQTADLAISVQNKGTTAMTSPIITFTASDGLMLTSGGSSFSLPDIAAGAAGTVTVRVKALDPVTQAAQSLAAEVKFNYDNGTGMAQSSASEKLNVPAAVTKAAAKTAIPQPQVLVSRSDPGTIGANQVFDVTFYFKNIGKTALQSPVATLSPADGLVLQNNSSSFALGDIPAGGTGSVTARFKAAKELSASPLSVSADLKFNYDSGDGTAQGTAGDKLSLNASVSSAAADGSAPSLIVSDFSYGGSAVAAGDTFKLRVTFANKGRVRMENIVLTADGGESFAVADSSNTFYYNALAAGGTKTEEISLQALATSKTGAQPVTLSFKYEYVDGAKRSSAASDIKVTVPVTQPDRFQLNTPAAPTDVTAGVELTLAINYVNKGKADVSNVEASITGDVDTSAPTQYLGNFEPGKSGSIGFVLTPRKAGSTSITLKITYEDANRKVQTREFPLTLNVKEPAPASDDAAVAAGTAAPKKPALWIVPAAVLITGGAAFAVVRRAKRKKAGSAQPDDWDSWEEPENARTAQPANPDGDKAPKE